MRDTLIISALKYISVLKTKNQPFMQTTKLWCDNATCALYIALPMYKSGLNDEYAGESGKNEFKKEKI